MKNLPIQIKILIGVVITLIIISTISSVTGLIYSTTVNLYNSSKELQLSYDKITQEQVTNYDGYYLAFVDKQENANINKETFITVTDIIMSNRRDGQNLAWKWCTENQQIPYHEFTAFYKELSSFISERYQDNMRVERVKQDIVQKHNLLISRWPNNYINRYLQIKELQYKQGYISEITKQKFK